jgi:hypothetical protein
MILVKSEKVKGDKVVRGMKPESIVWDELRVLPRESE